MHSVGEAPVRSSSAEITVAIVDLDPLARYALRTRLSAERDFEIVGEASDISRAIDPDRLPDLLLMGLESADPRGRRGLSELLRVSPQTRVVMLAAEADENVQIRALRAGAAGCLAKSIDLDVLPRVLRGVVAGEAAVTRALGTRVLEQVTVLSAGQLNRLRPVRSSLTQREWEVLDLLASGASTDGIARQLRVAPATVRTHIKHILGKLEMHSRDEAIRYVERLRHAWPGPFPLNNTAEDE